MVGPETCRTGLAAATEAQQQESPNRKRPPPSLPAATCLRAFWMSAAAAQAAAVTGRPERYTPSSLSREITEWAHRMASGSLRPPPAWSALLVVTAWDIRAGRGAVSGGHGATEQVLLRRALPVDYQWASTEQLVGMVVLAQFSGCIISRATRRWQPERPRLIRGYARYARYSHSLGYVNFFDSSALPRG